MPLCRKTSAVALGSNLGDSLALLSAAAQRHRTGFAAQRHHWQLREIDSLAA